MELFIYNHLEELQEYTYPLSVRKGKAFIPIFCSFLLHTLHLAWLGVVLVYFPKIFDMFIFYCFVSDYMALLPLCLH